jgi:putative transcriptional regulator
LENGNLHIVEKVSTGVLLLSDPFMPDTNFERSVVLICSHKESEGTFGFILNKMLDVTLSDLVNDETILPDVPVYLGGPVEQNTLHFIHSVGDKIQGSFEIAPGVFWGGNFTQMINCVADREVDIDEVRFFVGYSGWDDGQLDDEIKSNSWILSSVHKDVIFDFDDKELWRNVLKHLGGKYKQMSNYPIDPRLN